MSSADSSNIVTTTYIMQCLIEFIFFQFKIASCGYIAYYFFSVFWAGIVNILKETNDQMLENDQIRSKVSNFRFKDICGNTVAKKELEAVVKFLQNPSTFDKIGARLPKGVLLIGPPGVGKTLLAKAVAGEAEVPFFQCSGSQFDEKFVGTGAARVRKLFQEAKAHVPCFVFIDEFDSVGGKRVTSTIDPYANQTVNQLLAEMDGFSSTDGVIVLAATNRVDHLDTAVLRPGRFDFHVNVDLPDLEGRKEIFRLYLSKVKFFEDEIDVGKLAKMTMGQTGAVINNIVNQAAILAGIEGSTFVQWKHMQTAIQKVCGEKSC